VTARVAKSLPFITAALLALAALAHPARSSAQAPPGPLPGTAAQDSASAPATKAPAPNVPRIKNLAGTWKLNTDDSDDPRKKLQQAHGGGRGQGGGRSGGGMGGGWPGGHGGYGGRRQGAGESDEERQKMLLFLQPAQQLNIAQKEPEIDINDDSDRKFTAFTESSAP